MFGLGYVDPALISAVLNRSRFGAMGNFGYPRLPTPTFRPASLGPSQGLSPAAMLARMKSAGSYYGLPEPAPAPVTPRRVNTGGYSGFGAFSGQSAAQPYIRDRMFAELFAKNGITPESVMRRP